MQLRHRIAIVGAERTGKSWLARSLNTRLQERGQSATGLLDPLQYPYARPGGASGPEALQAMARHHAAALGAITTGTVVADTTPLLGAVYSHHVFRDESLYPLALEHQRLYDMTLVTGLDLYGSTSGLRADGTDLAEAIDTLLRQSLMQAGLSFQVVYGRGLTRLNNALMALGLEPADASRWQHRESAQFALNEGRTPWFCETCSDPDCEHRLFTSLFPRT